MPSASNSFIRTPFTVKKVIGVGVQNTPATSYTLGSFYNLNPTNYIHVISNLAEPYSLVSSNNKKYAIMASIPVLYGFGFVLNQTEDRDAQDTSRHNNHLNLSTINMRLVDDDFETFDLNGSDWTISFEYLEIISNIFFILL